MLAYMLHSEAACYVLEVNIRYLGTVDNLKKNISKLKKNISNLKKTISNSKKNISNLKQIILI